MFPVQSRTNENYYRFQHIPISQGTKYHLKQVVLIFGGNLPKKGIFDPKHKK